MTVPLKTRILLADDHEVVRNGLRMVLDSAPDLEVVAEAGDGAEAVELALADDIHLAVLDVSMPRMTGLQAALELSRRKPELRVLILSMHDNEQYFFEALKAGASGYVLKSVANRDLIEACRATMRGEPFLYPAAVRALVRDYLDRASRGETTPEDPLSPRELEVVKLIAEGMTSEEIAEQLFISKKTVDRHRANVLEKLGMRNRVELTRYAIRRGLVVPWGGGGGSSPSARAAPNAPARRPSAAKMLSTAMTRTQTACVRASRATAATTSPSANTLTINMAG
jgi:DNA-binding NarL/FixJ family response regulator